MLLMLMLYSESESTFHNQCGFKISNLRTGSMKVNEVPRQQRLERCSLTSGRCESLCCVHFGIFCIYILHFFFFPRRARPGQIYQKYQIGQPHMSARGQEAKKNSVWLAGSRWERIVVGILYSKHEEKYNIFNLINDKPPTKPHKKTKNPKLFWGVDCTNSNKRINKVGQNDVLQTGRNTWIKSRAEKKQPSSVYVIVLREARSVSLSKSSPLVSPFA